MGLDICILLLLSSPTDGVEITVLVDEEVEAISAEDDDSLEEEDCVDSPLVAPPIPARETRFLSNSTNTTFGSISLTIFPANSADDDDICAVPII
jgi:hypothetical protein